MISYLQNPEINDRISNRIHTYINSHICSVRDAILMISIISFITLFFLLTILLLLLCLSHVKYLPCYSHPWSSYTRTFTHKYLLKYLLGNWQWKAGKSCKRKVITIKLGLWYFQKRLLLLFMDLFSSKNLHFAVCIRNVINKWTSNVLGRSKITWRTFLLLSKYPRSFYTHRNKKK